MTFRTQVNHGRVHGPNPAPESDKRPAAPALSEADAIKTALEAFKHNAASRAVENGPYAAQSPKATRCIAPTHNGPCNLATKLKAPRCAIHADFAQFAALGIDAMGVYEGSPAESVLRTRAAALKL